MLTAFASLTLLVVAPTQTIHIEPADEWRLLRSEAPEAARKGLFALAETKATQAIAIAEKGQVPEEDALADSLWLLARIYIQQKKYDPAEPLMKRSLSLIETERGPQSFALCEPMGEMARLYLNTGRTIEAELMLERSVRIHHANKDPLEEPLAETLFALGQVYFTENKYAAAVFTFEQSITIWEKSHKSDRYILGTLLSLAMTHVALEEWNRAEPVLRRALKIEESIPSANAKDLGTILGLLSGVVRKLGREDEANQLAARAGAILNKQPPGEAETHFESPAPGDAGWARVSS